MSGEAHGPRTLARIYRWALVCFPAEFRRRFGDELTRSFLASCRHALRRSGRAGLFVAAARGLSDAVRSGLAERLGAFEGTRESPPADGTPPVRPTSPTAERATMESLFQDLRFAYRSLRQRPLFTLVAAVTLALGIGANTAVFSVVDALLLRPLPVENPDELVELFAVDPDSPQFSGPFSYPDYADLVERADTLQTLVGHSLTFVNWQREDGGSGLVSGEVVTGNYFDGLGIGLAEGRAFLPEESRTPGTHPVAVISWELWQTELGGGADVLDRSLRLNGVRFDVVGVAERGYRGLVPGVAADLWVPAMMSEVVDPMGIQNVAPSPTGDVRPEQRGNRWMMVKARPVPGATIEQVDAEVDSILAALSREYPETNEDYTARVVPASDVRIHPLVDGALGFAGAAALGMVGLVLLVACANVANMLLARASTRRQEISVRLALGAGRARLIRQLLTESLMLAAAGAALGVALAWWVIRFLGSFQPPVAIPLTLDLRIDLSVLLFSTGLTVAAAVLFGLAPALQASRPDLVEALKEGVRGSSEGGARRLSLRNVLVVVQVALCTVLLAGAALVLRGLGSAAAIDLGFEPERLAKLTVNPELNGYEDPDEGRAFVELLAERLRRAPEAEAVTIAGRAPLDIMQINQSAFYLPDRNPSPDDPPELISATRVDEHYFDTLGLELVAGRGIEATDGGDGARVAVVNEAMQRRYWPGESAVGKTLRRDLQGDDIRVVGVVQDYKVQTVGEDPRPYVHLPRSGGGQAFGTLIVRTAGPSPAALPRLRAALLEVQSDLVLLEAEPLTRLVTAGTFPARAAATLLGAFGGVALLLAAVGLYGVVAYAVSQRTREIGIRIALGADSGRVLRVILGQGLGLAGIGLVIGLLLSVGLGGLLSQLLYGVSGLDPVALTAASAVLIAVAALANLVPARRAARLDPTTAIRAE